MATPAWPAWARLFVRRLAGVDAIRNADPFVRQNYLHNFGVSLGDAVFYVFGLSFASTTVVLPLFLQNFTQSRLALGLILGLIDAGVALPQLFMVPFINRRSRQLPLVVGASVVPRAMFLFIAVLMAFSTRLPAPVVVVGMLGLIALFGLTIGIVVGPWQEMIVKTVPALQRGRFFGMRLTIAGLAGAVGAALAGWMLGALAFPINFAACLFITFASMMVSWGFLIFTREPTTPPRVTAAAPVLAHREGLALMRRDPNFLRFITAYWLVTLGGMATGFYAVYATQRFAASNAQAGAYNAIWFMANVVSNALWGWVNDRFGAKAVMVIGALAHIGALALALTATSVEWLYLVFALASAASAATLLASLTLPMVIGPEEERPLYIGLTNTLRAPVSVATSLLGGWLAQTYDYPVMFMSAAGLGLAGVVVLLWAVRVRSIGIGKPVS